MHGGILRGEGKVAVAARHQLLPGTHDDAVPGRADEVELPLHPMGPFSSGQVGVYPAISPTLSADILGSVTQATIAVLRVAPVRSE